MFGRTSRRIGAYLIDIALLFAVLAPLGQLVLRLVGRSPRTGPEIWLTILVNFSLPCWLYFIAGARSAGGATLGKRWLGVRVVGGPARSPPHKRSFAPPSCCCRGSWFTSRSLACRSNSGGSTRCNGSRSAPPTSSPLGYLLVTIATEGRRGVHDYVAHTSVDVVTERGRRHAIGGSSPGTREPDADDG